MALHIIDVDYVRPLSPPNSLERLALFESKDLRKVQDYLSSVLAPHRLRSQNQILDFHCYGTSVRGMAFNYIEYGPLRSPIDMIIPDTGDCYTIRFALSGRCELLMNRQSIDLEAGTLVAINPNRAGQTRMHGDYAHLTIRIDRQTLLDAITWELGFVPSEPLQFDLTPMVMTNTNQGLTRLIRLVWDDLTSPLPQLMKARAGQHVQRALLSSIICSFNNNYTSLLDEGARMVLPNYIRKTIRFIQEHASDPLGLPDLVEASGVSTRSLHASFQKFLKTSPMTYLRIYRLDMAHAKLLKMDDNLQSVTEIALDCGFNHLSKFASDFRLRFGKLPSEVRAGLLALPPRNSVN